MKRRLIAVAIVLLLMPLSLLLFTNATSLGKVIGKIEGLQIENGSYYIYGWACHQNSSQPISLHFYSEAASGHGGKMVMSGKTEFMAEDEISSSSVCASASGSRHRFKLKLTDSLLQKQQGKAIYIHGISLLAGHENPVISNSGLYRFPPPLTSTRIGCLPTAMAKRDSRNTYQSDYLQGQNNPWIYVAWVWRETPDAATNHSLSVARSKDMVNWENTCGEKLKLPINSDARTVLDPVVPGSGIMNSVKLGFDKNGQPIISYHKHHYVFSTSKRPVMTTQVYNARLGNTGWKISQMTNWTTQANQVGGGSLGKSSTTPGYNAVTTDRDGIMYQTFTRPSADTIGTPQSGTWIIPETNEVLQKPLVKYDPKKRTPDFYEPVSGIGPMSIALESRGASWKTPFTSKVIRTTSDERWITLRGDWDGDGNNDAGLFDRKMRKFVIRDGAKDKSFLFGPGNIPQWPIVGDWDGDGIDTIGVYDSVTNKFFGKNSLIGGSGDAINKPLSQLNIKDGVALRWYDVNPHKTHAVSYETLPANNDLPYDCTGVPYKKNEAKTFVDGEEVIKQCSNKFLSDMYLHIYDQKNSRWDKILIDRVWGVGGSFAFKVFKGHQIIAYYDSNRHVKVAIRNKFGDVSYQILDDVFKGWDSHNYLTLNIDENHDIHLAGDQHVNPLNYWRSKGLNTNFKRYAQTGVAESRVTYPSFFRDPNGELLFQYRDGSSGDGEWVINRYDIRKGTWRRLLSTPLFDRK